MKKNPTKSRTLTLSRKTLRALSDDRLARVGGGTMEGMIGEYQVKSSDCLTARYCR